MAVTVWMLGLGCGGTPVSPAPSTTGGTGGSISASSTAGSSPSGGSTGSTTLNPGVAPGGNFDLSIWSLQLPVCSSGTVTTVPPQFPLPASLVGESFSFKAGDSDQTATAGTPGTAPGTLVEIHPLSVTHR